MDDRFQAPVPVPGSQEETFGRLSQGEGMSYHIGHVDPVILDPLQGCRQVMEISRIGMGDRHLLLPKVP